MLKQRSPKMRIVGIILILLMSFSCDTENSFPVPEENYFVKFYGEEGDQEGVDFIVNADGSVVMVGNTVRPGVEQQIYVVKVDANGQVLWQRRIGLPDKKDIARDIELHPDGRIVIAGETEMGVGNRDFYLKTLSLDGVELDSIREVIKIGTVTDEEVNSVSIINDGFMIAGATNALESGAPSPNDLRDAMHLRFDNSLNRIDELSNWSEVTGTSNSDDVATKIIEILPDSVYYVFGYSNNSWNGDGTTDYDFWIFQLNSKGTTSGVNPIFGDSNEDDKLTSVDISPNQSGPGYLLSGISTRSNGFSQSYIVKTNKSDDLLTTGKDFDEYPLVLGANAEGMVRTFGQVGESFLHIADDKSSGSDIFLLKLTREFSPDWQVPLIFNGKGDDIVGAVNELPDGRILLFGTMTVGGLGGQKKMVLMKLNPEGKLTE